MSTNHDVLMPPGNLQHSFKSFTLPDYDFCQDKGAFIYDVTHPAGVSFVMGSNLFEQGGGEVGFYATLFMNVLNFFDHLPCSYVGALSFQPLGLGPNRSKRLPPRVCLEIIFYLRFFQATFLFSNRVIPVLLPWVVWTVAWRECTTRRMKRRRNFRETRSLLVSYASFPAITSGTGSRWDHISSIFCKWNRYSRHWVTGHVL